MHKGLALASSLLITALLIMFSTETWEPRGIQGRVRHCDIVVALSCPFFQPSTAHATLRGHENTRGRTVVTILTQIAEP